MNVFLPPGTKISTRNATSLVFELPSMKHECRIDLYTNYIHMSVWLVHATTSLEKVTFDLRNTSMRWEDLAQAFIEAACRKYPKPVRNKSITDNMIRRGW